MRRDDSAEKFGLETAPALVESVFGAVEVRRYPDALLVTDMEAVVQYAVSTLHPDERPEAGVQMLRQIVHDIIARHGVFRIDKDAGALLSRKSA